MNPSIELPHHGFEPWRAAQHCLFAHDHARLDHFLFGDQLAGQVAAADIFGNRGADIVIERRLQCRIKRRKTIH